MRPTFTSRFRFIAHALNGDGPFRPEVSVTTLGTASLAGETYLVRYPRESEEKFARRNELAFYASPLAQACQRFAGYLTEKPPVRDLTANALYKTIADDCDGNGNAIDVFWSSFAVEAKARGTMLLLVDMPAEVPQNLAAQIQRRAVPYLSAIEPERVQEYEIGADGRFDHVEFAGTYKPEGAAETVAVTWRFTRASWSVRKAGARDGERLAGGEHALGECPVILFSETGRFPCFGPFAAIADIAKRLFNLDSELDEILRSQTFSLLTMQVTAESTEEQKREAARTVGITVGTNNLLLHTGSTPAFVAPPEGPARTYMDRAAKLQERIDEIGLTIASPQSRESGISLQMRFHAINAAVSKFSERMEDLERRTWELCRKWLGLQQAPTASWSRNFNIADIANEMDILTQMNANAMPREVIVEQQQRIVSLQFAGSESLDEMTAAIDEQLQERV
jgi:hypothetical protein